MTKIFSVDLLIAEAKKLGFSQISSSLPIIPIKQDNFQNWLDNNMHGDMAYLVNNLDKRFAPIELLPETKTILTLKYPYYHHSGEALSVLDNPNKAYISRYALNRDYHNVLRKKLTKLGAFLSEFFPHLTYRPFTDSAPILERQLAEQSGLGFTGKNSLIIDTKAGSFFFLAELFISEKIEIPQEITKNHCGSCHKCLDKCPTDAIIKPFVIDARKCISYLTIEHFGSIPLEFRKPMGNRIYGCDDCQLYCPWNKFSPNVNDSGFSPRHQLDNSSLLSLFEITKEQFLKRFEGSPIRRIGYERFLRNLSIALGNAPFNPLIIKALEEKDCDADYLKEHFTWAINEQLSKKP